MSDGATEPATPAIYGYVVLIKIPWRRGASGFGGRGARVERKGAFPRCHLFEGAHLVDAFVEFTDDIVDEDTK
jgi:hypothetical protein